MSSLSPSEVRLLNFSVANQQTQKSMIDIYSAACNSPHATRSYQQVEQRRTENATEAWPTPSQQDRPYLVWFEPAGLAARFVALLLGAEQGIMAAICPFNARNVSTSPI